MQRAMRVSTVLSLVVAVAASTATAKTSPRIQKRPRIAPPRIERIDSGRTLASFNTTVATTTVVYSQSFDGAGGCTAAGWTAVDRTAQAGTFFHIDDYSGLSGFAPLQGAQSLWCGLRPTTTGVGCNYVTLPGYGNSWNQQFETKDCIPVSGDLDMSFLLHVDSEPSYDYAALEYTADCSGATGWTQIDGGTASADAWTGTRSYTINKAYPVGGASDVRVRFHFYSDGGFSDADGLFNSNGALHIDNLVAEGLPLEDFEDEAVGATSANDWVAGTPPSYGSFAGLVSGGGVLQEDPCVRDLSCMWAFFVGSPYDYSCGGHPEQLAVPFQDSNGLYLNNEIWSPDIPLTGSGPKFVLEFSVYRDLPLANQIYYLWHVRNGYGPCPGYWYDHNIRYFGDGKDWYVHREDVSDLIEPGAPFVNIALAARDYCPFGCNIHQPGTCHSQAPLFDNVRLLRIDAPVGPVWTVDDAEQFQDNFATDGTLTGTVRADPAAGYDHAVVGVADPTGAFDTDPVAGGKAIYIYVSVWPQGQPGKSGASLSDDAVNWPVVGSWTDMGGITWTRIRMSLLSINGTYEVDLRDNLFTPGDTVCYFYAARDTSGTESYAFGPSLSLTTFDREEAASNASEFTCLPAGGYNHGGDILYVDGMDGRGAQPYWDTVFASLGVAGQVDRYDVRAPSVSTTGNRLAGRVINVSQLTSAYRKILWDTGDLAATLQAGGLNMTNDWGLMNQFLDQLPGTGGVYLCGDDLPSQLANLTGGSAVTFRTTYLTFNLTSDDARPVFGVSPTATPVGGSFFADSFVIEGGCPLLNDFDVMEPTGGSAMQIAYNTPAADNGAVLSKVTTNSQAVDVGVVLSGFSFIYIADDDVDGVSDRAQHLHDIITWLGNTVSEPTGAAPLAINSLSQNYPNPFNPQTTIAFSVKERGRVRLAVYDVSGALVRTLANEDFAAGLHTATWDGRNDAGQPVASGVYFYKLIAGDFSHTRKMVLLK
jgi:FlgD Ig-like domain